MSFAPCRAGPGATVAGLESLPAADIAATHEPAAQVVPGHTLQDANAAADCPQDRRGPFSNLPREAPNDRQEIIKLIRYRGATGANF
jgi:hypothetical protein